MLFALLRVLRVMTRPRRRSGPDSDHNICACREPTGPFGDGGRAPRVENSDRAPEPRRPRQIPARRCVMILPARQRHAALTAARMTAGAAAFVATTACGDGA